MSDKWITMAHDICDDAGIKVDEIEIITTWEQTFVHNDEVFRNNAVFRIGDEYILKAFWTDAERSRAIERVALQTLAGGFPVPQYVADGVVDGRPYLVMSKIDGETLQNRWDAMSKDELLTFASEVGEQTAQLHRFPIKKLAEVESQFGRGENEIEFMEAQRIKEIKAMPTLSTHHKDELLRFVHEEARPYLDPSSWVFNHGDLSHAHIYLARQSGKLAITGWIDWGGAVLGMRELDITFHWFWTFSQDRDTMREFLKAYYQHIPKPEQYARRCFVAHFYTYSMEEVWDYFTETVKPSDSIVPALITTLYPPEIFGAPD